MAVSKGKVIDLNSHKPVRPFNRAAERGILGAFMIDPQLIFEPWAMDTLEPSDFDETKHELIYRAIVSVAEEGTPPSARMVDERLKQNGELGIVGNTYTSELVNACESLILARKYAEIVLENALLRKEAGVGESLRAGTINADEAMRRLQDLSHRREKANKRTFTLAELMDEEIAPLKWIVPGFIPEGLTVLGAKQKIGKSWFTYATAIAVANGGMVLGQRVDQGDVLYLALEDSKRRLQERARKLLIGGRVPSGLTLATTWERLDNGGATQIERWLKAHPRARVVFIDVYAKIRPPRSKYGDPYQEDYAAMSILKKLADAYHVAVVIIHHTRKASAEDVFDELSGSTGIGGAADALMVLQRARGEVDATLHITGREIEREAKYALRFDATTCCWQMIGDADEYGHGDQQDAVLHAIKHNGPITPKRLLAALDWTPDKSGQLGVILHRLAADKGLIRSIGKEGYVLTTTVNVVNTVNPVMAVNVVNASLETEH